MKYKICHVTSVHQWEDIRIFKKECTSLAKHFEEVYLVAPFAPNTTVNNVVLVPVPGFKKVNKILRIFFEKKKVLKVALSIDAAIYHLHDPELLSFVKPLQKKGKKVIFDSHENVAATILEKEWIPFKWMRKLVSKLYANYEKRICRKVDGVISVLPEITKIFNYTLTETIYNYPIINELNREIASKEISDPFKIIYNGGLTKIRGIKDMCEALNFLENGKYQLILLGSWESEKYKEDCIGSVKNKAMVCYKGNMSFEDCQKELSQANMGIITFHKVPNHLVSLPNKSFEFIMNGLPMVMSDIDFWKSEFKASATFVDPYRPELIANGIKKVKENYSNEIQNIMLKRQEVIENQSWQSQEKKLVDFYLKILQ